MRAHESALPVVDQPDAGRVWVGTASVRLGDGTDLLPGTAVRDRLDVGTSPVGGCCGSGPVAVSAIAAVAARSGAP